jgi:hypothetical protein
VEFAREPALRSGPQVVDPDVAPARLVVDGDGELGAVRERRGLRNAARSALIGDAAPLRSTQTRRWR